MKYLIPLLITLAACSGDNYVECPQQNSNIAVYGDSLCADCTSAPYKLGIEAYCRRGMPLVSLGGFYDKHELIFLGFGTNDTFYDVEIDVFTDKLNDLIGSTDADVICILPNPLPHNDSTPYRNAMISNCADYIDPIEDCGVSIGASDGIHYIEQDYQSLAACMQENINAYTSSR